MPHDFHQDLGLADGQVDELLDDIEMRCRADVGAARDMTGIHRKLAVTIRPGNASERDSRRTEGQTLELRHQGATCLVPTPIAVGDIFHIAFDPVEIDVEPQLAVCDRCTLLGDSGFEARFRFVLQIRLPVTTAD